MNKEQLITTYRFVNQRHAIDRFEDSAIDNLLSYYNRARKQTLKDISKTVKNSKASYRLSVLLREIDGKIKSLMSSVGKPVAEAIGEAGEYSYRSTNAILAWDGAVSKFNNVSMSANQITQLVTKETLGGHTLDYWLWNTLGTENKALKAEISAAKIRGVGYKKLMSELGSRYDSMLSSETVKHNLETVTKSYIQSMNAKSHKDIYEANRSVIKKVEWSAIMENGNTKTGRGTCPRCMALDGMEYESVASGPPMPLHPRCRCMYLPVTKTWEELGIKDIEERKLLDKKWNDRDLYTRKINRLGYKNVSKNEPVALLLQGNVDANFPEWWEARTTTKLRKAKIPSSFQANAAGWNRAWLILNTDLEFKDIVYDNGVLKTVKHLKNKVGVEVVPRKK